MLLPAAELSATCALVRPQPEQASLAGVACQRVTLVCPLPRVLQPSICLQVPFMVGDFVTYAGVTTGAGFFAAYEIVSNVAVYTKVRRRHPTLQHSTDDTTSTG